MYFNFNQILQDPRYTATDCWRLTIRGCDSLKNFRYSKLIRIPLYEQQKVIVRAPVRIFAIRNDA